MIEWAFTSSILIAVIMLLRRVLKGKISLRLQYALWAIVVLRLLIPISFGSSNLSVMNIVSAVSFDESIVDTGTFNELGQIPQTNSDTISPVNNTNILVVVPHVARDQMVAVKTSLTLSLREVPFILWLLGAVVMLGIFATANLKFGSKLRKTRALLTATDSLLPVYVSEAVDTPCLFGVFRPTIYITPEAAADEVVKSHAIAHEITHFRHGDSLWSLLRCLCIALHWYNPLVWWAAFLSLRDAELACDGGTIT